MLLKRSLLYCLLVLCAAGALSGCREGEVLVRWRDLPPEEKRALAEVEPYIQRINRRPQDTAAYLQASRILRKTGYTSYALMCMETGLLYSPHSLELLLEKARIEEAMGLYGEALKSYRKVLESAPEDVSAVRGAARCLYRTGRREEAAAALANAKQLAPNDPGIVLDEADFAYYDGNIERAFELSQEASNLAPHLPGPYYNQGLALLRLGRLDEALAAAKKALALSPDAAEIHALLAEINYAQGRTDAAKTSADKALEIAPHFDQPYRTLGKLAQDAGEIDAAATYFRKAVALNPSDVYSLLKLRGFAEARKDDELALFALRRLSRLNPADETLREELALAALRQQQYSEAAAEYRILAEKNPANADFWKGLGGTYAAIGDKLGVIEAYHRLDALGKAGPNERLELAAAYVELGASAEADRHIAALSAELPQDDPRFARVLGQKLYREGRTAEALDYLMVAAATGDEDAVFKAALVSAALKRYEDAAAMLEDLYTRQPTRTDLARLIAEINDRMGRTEDAHRYYGSVLTFNPDDVAAGEFMARYHLKRGDTAAAREAVGRVLAVHPDSAPALTVKAEILEASGEFVGALGAYAKALDAEPSRKDLLDAVARIQKKVPESRSINDLRAAFRKNPDDYGILWDIAEMEAQTDPARAIGTLRLLSRHPAARRAALERISSLYFRLDRPAEAVAAARRIAKLYPDDPRSFTFLAETLAQTAAYRPALDELTKALDLSPAYVPALRLAGRIHLATDAPERAAAMYLSLLNVDPADTDALMNLCRIYVYYRKDLPRARMTFAELERLGVRAPDIEKAINELETKLPMPPAPRADGAQPPTVPQPAEAPAGITEDAALSFGPDKLPAIDAPTARQ